VQLEQCARRDPDGRAGSAGDRHRHHPVPQHRPGHGRELGKPGYPFLDTPHPIANLTEADLDERADRLADAVDEWLGFEAH
jgi:hypothetical protein